MPFFRPWRPATFLAGPLAMLLVLVPGPLRAAGVSRRPALRSAAVLVQDQRTGELLLQKRSGDPLPIASLTKLMTAMVLLDAHLDLKAPLTILEEDKDTLRHSKSHLPVGTVLTRGDALLVALMASENRAAHALARTFPGGVPAFVAAMNAKAKALALPSAHFLDPAGLEAGNVANALDLARIVDRAGQYELVRTFTTRTSAVIDTGRRTLTFHNTNHLLLSSRWHIGLSKTGFIDESGQCLVMQAQLASRPVLIVLLDASGRMSRFEDANRIRTWMEGPEVVKVRRVRRRRR